MHDLKARRQRLGRIDGGNAWTRAQRRKKVCLGAVAGWALTGFGRVSGLFGAGIGRALRM